jgi:hypothetical protein
VVPEETTQILAGGEVEVIPLVDLAG